MDITNLSIWGLIFVSIIWRDVSEYNFLTLESHVIVQEVDIHPMPFLQGVLTCNVILTMNICSTQKHMQAWNRKDVCSPDGAASLLIDSKWGNLRNLFPESCSLGAPGTSRHDSTATTGVCWTTFFYSGPHPKKRQKQPKHTKKSQRKDD